MPKYRNKKNGATVDVPSSPGDDWELAEDSEDAYKNGAVRNFGTAANPDWRERSNGKWVPLDDVGVGASDPSALLGANGYKWQSGQGRDALWVDPEGRTVTEAAATLRVQKEGSARPAAGSPGASTAMTAGQSAQIAESQANRAENIRQFDLTMQAKEAENAAAAARAAQTQRFLEQKEAFAESQDNKRLANETAQQLFTNNLTIVQLQTQRAQMQAQRDQFNAQQALAVQQANESARQANQQVLAQANRDTAQFAQNPTDYGKFAAFSLANSGWGKAANASGGVDLTSQESLQPLQGALDTRREAQNWKAPYQFTPLPELPQISLPQIPTPQAGAAATAGAAGVPSPYGITDPDDKLSTIDLAALIAGDKDVLKGTSYEDAAGLPKAAKGGIVSSQAYMGDEDGAEIHIPLGPGQALVIPADKVKAMKPDERKRLKKMADGGVFSGGGIFNTGLKDTTEANQFRLDAFNKGVANTPFAAGGLRGLPTPVYASSPGFSPLVAQLLASLNALGKGVSQDFFLQQANLLAPTAMGQRAVGRTA